MHRQRLWIGTSGWSYQYWRETFYPLDLKPTDWISFYADHFRTVEVNSSFYHLIPQKTFSSWKQKTPDYFIFSVKLSRYITHVKRLKGVSKSWIKFKDSIRPLKEKLGPILIQFPSNWHAEEKRLEAFINLLPRDYLFAFEFRHQSWFSRKIFSLLSKNNHAVVIQDSPRWPRIEELTANFVYLRLHGSKVLYGSRYSQKELEQWAKKIKNWLLQNLTVYAYFNNDAKGFAIKNAQELISLLGGRNE